MKLPLRHFAFIIAFLLSIPSVTHSQNYYPMPDTEAQWVITRCFSFYPGGWYDKYTIVMDGTDTILHGKIYSRLYLTTHHLPGTEHDSTYTHYLGGMRESDSLVYMVSELLTLDTFERLIYDFREAQIGDTIHTQVLTNGLLHFVPHIVTAVDFVEVDGTLRRRIHLRDEQDVFSEYWIEGLGSSLGLVYASYWLLTDNSYDLNCFYHTDDVAFVNADPLYSFCTPPLPEISCDPLSTSIPDEVVSKTVVFPNPASDHLRIESSLQSVLTEVLTTSGQVILRSHASIINIEELPTGLYIIRLTGPEKELIAVDRFVKM